MFCRCSAWISLRHFVVAALAGLVLLVSCGGDTKEERPKLPRMPEGVKSDLLDPHCPDTTYLKDQGGLMWIQVDVPLLTKPEHHISWVRVVAPMPGFKELGFYAYTKEDLQKEKNKPWAHLFKIPRAKLPEGLSAVLVISHCDQHGDFGAIQAVFNFGR
jgi:desulfoferrodoxin (superoxide reductase-like protein)